jgi:hypothetical protein
MLEYKQDLQMYGLDDLERCLPRYHALMTSDGGRFACCIANGMTGAVRCVMTTAKTDLTRAEAAEGPQGSEATGDELMTSEPWSVSDCEAVGFEGAVIDAW